VPGLATREHGPIGPERGHKAPRRRSTLSGDEHATSEPKATTAPAGRPRRRRNGPGGRGADAGRGSGVPALPEKAVIAAVSAQGLQARLVGREWRFLKAAIQRWLSVPTLMENKDAWMGPAGTWKDDPYAEEELKEIYRRRRPPRDRGRVMIVLERHPYALFPQSPPGR